MGIRNAKVGKIIYNADDGDAKGQKAEVRHLLSVIRHLSSDLCHLTSAICYPPFDICPLLTGEPHARVA